MYDFCTPELQQQLAPARTVLKDYQDKLALVGVIALTHSIVWLCFVAELTSHLQVAPRMVLALS